MNSTGGMNQRKIGPLVKGSTKGNRAQFGTQTNYLPYIMSTPLGFQVNSIHAALTRWMVNLLPQIVPDHCDDRERALLPAGPHTTVIMEVFPGAKNLSQKLNNFSKYAAM